MRRGGPGKSRQPVEVGLVEDELPLPLVMQDILAEPGMQGRQTLGYRGHALLLFGAQQCPAAHQAEVMALEEAQLIGVQPERRTPRMEIGNPREQGGVEGDPHLMLGEARRVIAGDGFQRVVGITRIEVEEHPAHPLEQTAAALQRLDRVGKGGRRRGAGDRGDFGDLLFHAPLEGRWEVLGTKPIEGRHPERRGPGLQERVFGHSTLGQRLRWLTC